MTGTTTTGSKQNHHQHQQQLAVSYWSDVERPPHKLVETKNGRGKGKLVVLTPEQPRQQSATGRLQIAAVSEEDARHGELPSDPVARVDQRLSYEWVRYVRFGSSPQEAYSALSTMWASEPVLMQAGKQHQSAFVSCLMDFDAVAARVDEASTSTSTSTSTSLAAMVSDAKLHRFMEFDLGKNDAKGPYHVREFETQLIGMGSVREFVQCARSWEKRKVFLALTGDAARAAADDVIDWEALNGVLASQRFSVVDSAVRVEMGTRNGVLPARYATHDQLLVQAHGRRRVTLAAPSQAFGHLYPYPTHHPYDGLAMASLETLNPEDWPGTKDLRLHRAVLAPGDVLYVPAYWFVHVHELDAETVCLRVPLSSGVARGGTTARRPPAGDATLLRVSRVVEDRVSQTVGVSNVKRWLRIIANNAETKYVDLATVAGYKCARMTQDIRDDLDTVLANTTSSRSGSGFGSRSGSGSGSRSGSGSGSGSLSASAACRLIIDHRLEPTPWLNQGFREPLLLADTPKIYQDTRTDEERKYPTLFRKKLERDGWSVQQTTSTVPIPGVNIPVDADYRLL